MKIVLQRNSRTHGKVMSRAGSFTRGVNYRKLSEKYISLLLLLFLTPLVFVILGIVVSSSKNHRPELIQKYFSYLFSQV